MLRKKKTYIIYLLLAAVAVYLAGRIPLGAGSADPVSANQSSADKTEADSVGLPADCGRVIFGDLDWDSSRFHVEVASYILQKGMGCRVDRIPGTTMPLLTALGKGDIHVLMEVWKQNLEDAWAKFSDQGRVINLGVNFPDAVQGFYVPAWLVRGPDAAAPGLKSVFDLKEHWQLFKDEEVPAKGRFYNCILGWSCEDVNTKKLKAYGLLDRFTNFRPGTGAALSAVIASKYRKREPFVAYYWGPTSILGKYDLVMLKEPAYDEEIWNQLVNGNDFTEAVEYPVVRVIIGANAAWARNNPIIAAFLKRYHTTNKLISNALAFMQDEKGRTPADAARHFLKTRTDVWTEWLDDETARRVSRSLGIEGAKKTGYRLNPGELINETVDWIVLNYGEGFKSMGQPVLAVILFSEKVLLAVPWWLITLLIGLLTFYLGKKRLVLLLTGCMAMIYLLGLWKLSMQTLALMLISTLVSTLLGLPLGILSARSDRFRTVLVPVLDAMQTMPSFVYLIPALMLFGLGKVPALFATVIYSVVPTIRLTDLGLRQVDPHIIEAATSFGTREWQLLTRIKLPLALPTIMAGINQSIMMALSMVVIASMIGARGLGEQVLLGIQKLDVGQGFTAGLAIVLLAVVIDRLTQNVGKRLDKTR